MKKKTYSQKKCRKITENKKQLRLNLIEYFFNVITNHLFHDEYRRNIIHMSIGFICLFADVSWAQGYECLTEKYFFLKSKNTICGVCIIHHTVTWDLSNGMNNLSEHMINTVQKHIMLNAHLNWSRSNFTSTPWMSIKISAITIMNLMY